MDNEEDFGLFTRYEIAQLLSAIRLLISGNRDDLVNLARGMFGEMTRSKVYRDGRLCYRYDNSFELHIGDEIELYHSFANTIITRDRGIIHYDIEGERSEYELNDENLFLYVIDVLLEL